MAIPGLLSPDHVENLRRAYEDLIELYLADRGGIDALEGKTFGRNHLGMHPAVTAPWSDPAIVANPVIDAVLSELLGPDYQCGYYHSNAAYPGSGVQPVHRDSGSLFSARELNTPHPPVSIVLNVPLCAFTEKNGSTEVWPGSHLIVDRDASDASDLEARAASLASARTNVPVGSMILRDLRMFHRGMPNLGSTVRPMLSIVYVRGFLNAAVLEIPQRTWDGWPERVRQIFRNNRVVPDAEAANHYRITKSGQ